MSKISIIIPIFNEAKIIGKQLQHLRINSSSKNILEIIVVDGESVDKSFEILSSFNDITYLNSKKGRARQMNMGAKHAKGDILYFLHADSFPPNQFDTYILNEVKQNNDAGCFRMRFDSNHWWLKLAGYLTKFNSKACRGGDQSLFITKALFEELNGYDENYTIYEDYELINKLYKRNHFKIIPEQITTSARRYNANGIWKLQYHFWAIYIKKWFGASADELHKYYRKHIA